MNLGEYMKDKDVKCSANVELALYKLAQDLGIKPSKISVGIYDKEFGENGLHIILLYKYILWYCRLTFASKKLLSKNKKIKYFNDYYGYYNIFKYEEERD